MFFLSGSILGMARKSASRNKLIRGKRMSPQNFSMYPSAFPSAFQCVAMVLGKIQYPIPAIRNERMMIPYRMGFVFMNRWILLFHLIVLFFLLFFLPILQACLKSSKCGLLLKKSI